jgi:predicted RNA-binding protein with PUA-like domain
LAEPDQTTGWDGVRNFQARNTLRDGVKLGDGVLFYHSSADPPSIAGIAEVVREGHPDPTAFDHKAMHYDPKSDPESPTWFQVSIRAVRPIDPPIGLPELRTLPALGDMVLLRKGSRLSIQPVTASEWQAILAYDQERQVARVPPAPPKRTKHKPAPAAKPARIKKHSR